MPQLSVYVDQELLREISKAAKKERSSVSRWVQARLRRSLRSSWPDEYEKLFGALKDVNFKRPPQGKFKDDAPREKL